MKRPDGTVAHAEIEIGECCVMLADENPAINALSAQHFGGCPITLMIYRDDCDAVYARTIAAGGTSVREPADQPYGDRMGGVMDPFGYTWWIATHITDSRGEGESPA